jgi:protein TonB
MKPENILESDLLDIIFANRNKDYGAYTLRRNYSSTLIKSFAVTVLFSLSIAIALHIKSKFFNDKSSIAAGLPVHQFQLIKPAEQEKKKTVAKVVKRLPKHAQKAYVTPQIVKDELADKEVPQLEELKDKVIGTIDERGTSKADDELFIPAQEEGNSSEGKAIDKPTEPEEVAAPLMKAEVMPEFPGGMEAFKKFMLRHLRQPELSEGEKVVVKVQFVVDADGSIKNTNILQTGGVLDTEVIRVVGKMPKWKPGVQNGRYVAVYFTLPVTFLGADY